MIQPTFAYPGSFSPAGQPLAWPGIAPSAPSAMQPTFAYPGSFPMVRPPSSAALLPNGATLHHPSTSPWPSMQMPFTSLPAATLQTMPNINPHQMAAPHQVVSGASMSAGLAAPYMWDSRYLPTSVPPSSYPQSILSVSYGGPTGSANSAGGISLQPTNPAHHQQMQQQMQQQQQQQQLMAPMASPDSACAAAAAAAAAAALSARQQSTSQLSAYLAERQHNSAHPSHPSHPTPQAPTASPCSSGPGYPHPYPRPAAVTAAPMLHHTVSAFNTLAQPTALAPPPPRPAPAPPQPAPAPAPAAPASIRSTLGPAAYSAVRSLMLQQQSTYVQQLFELHKLCQLQQLLSVELQESISMDNAAATGDATAAAANDAGTSAAVTQMQLLSHAPSNANQQAQEARAPPSSRPGPGSEANGPRHPASQPAAVLDAEPSMSSLSDDAPAAQQAEEEQVQRHLGLINLGNLPKAIRKVIDGRALRFPNLATQSRSVTSMGLAGVAGVVRPLPLYLVPCDPSGGGARPTHSIQATVQQQLLDVDHRPERRTSSPDREAGTARAGGARAWAPAASAGQAGKGEREREASKQAPLRRASEELLGLVGGAWRYAPPPAKACTDVAPGQALQQRQQQQQQQERQQQQASKAQQAMSLPNAGGYCEPLPHKARQIRPQAELSLPRQRPAASDTSHEQPAARPTYPMSPSGEQPAARPTYPMSPSGERHLGRRQRSPGSETSGRPGAAPGPGAVDASLDAAASRRPTASGSARDVASPHGAGAPAAAAAAPPARMGLTAAAATATAVPALQQQRFTPNLLQAPPQPLASPVDIQAVWYAQHFPKSVAVAKQLQGNSQAAAATCSMRVDGHPSAHAASQLAAERAASRAARDAQDAEPSSRGDVQGGGMSDMDVQGGGMSSRDVQGGASLHAPVAHASSMHVPAAHAGVSKGAAAHPAVHWWQDGSLGHGNGNGNGSSCGLASSAPQCSGYDVDVGPSPSKKVRGTEYQGQAQYQGQYRSGCNEMRHDSSAAAAGAGPGAALDGEGAEAGRAAAAAAGFQRFKRHNGRKQQSKHASNGMAANRSQQNKSNAYSGGGSGTESVAEPGSPKTKKNTQTAESGGDTCKKARSAAGAGAGAGALEAAAPACVDAGDAYNSARSAAGILLSLSGMSG